MRASFLKSFLKLRGSVVQTRSLGICLFPCCYTPFSFFILRQSTALPGIAEVAQLQPWTLPNTALQEVVDSPRVRPALLVCWNW